MIQSYRRIGMMVLPYLAWLVYIWCVHFSVGHTWIYQLMSDVPCYINILIPIHVISFPISNIWGEGSIYRLNTYKTVLDNQVLYIWETGNRCPQFFIYTCFVQFTELSRLWVKCVLQGSLIFHLSRDTYFSARSF